MTTSPPRYPSPVRAGIKSLMLFLYATPCTACISPQSFHTGRVLERDESRHVIAVSLAPSTALSPTPNSVDARYHPEGPELPDTVWLPSLYHAGLRMGIGYDVEVEAGMSNVSFASIGGYASATYQILGDERSMVAGALRATAHGWTSTVPDADNVAMGGASLGAPIGFHQNGSWIGLYLEPSAHLSAAHRLPHDQSFAPLLYGGALGARLGPHGNHVIIEARALWGEGLTQPVTTLGIAWIGAP